MRTIDAKGLICPQPLILTKKALKETGVNERFIILIDNETSKKNVERFLRDNSAESECVRHGKVFQLTVTKLMEEMMSPIAEDYCDLDPNEKERKGKQVYVFKTKGVAPDELGQMLTMGFLETIKDVEPLPDKMVFYHEGVYLTLEDSPVLEKLQALEKLGIEMLICGNCVNFYEVLEKVKVGIVSNAHDILKSLTDASHLIYP